MKLIAITACPTGIAHTYMAAEHLELQSLRPQKQPVEISGTDQPGEKIESAHRHLGQSERQNNHRIEQRDFVERPAVE